MQTKKHICITFAGVVWSSKTPITNYISTKLNLPVFNNDAIRSEVIEDCGTLDIKDHRNRRNSRLEEIIKSKQSFICDLSVDREWKEFKELLVSNGYQYFVISLDLTKDLLIQLYQAKWYSESLERINQLIKEHNLFLKEYSDDININISDKDFLNRCQISYRNTSQWIENIKNK